MSATCIWERKKFRKETKWKCDEHPVLPSVSTDRPQSPSTTPALQWLVCSYVRGQSCGMPGKLWKPLKATTQRHKGKKAGFDTRIGSPTSSSDFIINPVVELDFLCRHIQRLKRRSLVPLGGEIHTHVYTMNLCSRRLPVLVHLPSFPPSIARMSYSCAHVRSFMPFFFFFF